MAETLGPMSELEAVNEMLAAIGEAPVSSLASLPPDGSIAQSTLYRVSRNLQEQGWHFNTDTDVELTKDGSNEYPLGSTVLRIDTSGSEDVAVRGDSGTLKLWDKTNQTFTFTTSPIKCEIVYHFAWADLPQHVRRYVVALAIREFLIGFPGHPSDANTARLLEYKFQTAAADFYRTESRDADLNILLNPNIASILRRS